MPGGSTPTPTTTTPAGSATIDVRTLAHTSAGGTGLLPRPSEVDGHRPKGNDRLKLLQRGFRHRRDPGNNAMAGGLDDIDGLDYLFGPDTLDARVHPVAGLVIATGEAVQRRL